MNFKQPRGGGQVEAEQNVTLDLSKHFEGNKMSLSDLANYVNTPKCAYS